MRWDTTIQTRDGVFTASFTDQGLAELSFPDRALTLDRQSLEGRAPRALQWQDDTASALHAVLRGEQPKRFPPFDLSHGTPFQQKVWKAMLEIPTGSTRSYGELAEAIGAPGASRAVGGACGANRIPVLIPCHRVLAANKHLGGFSAGLKWKRLLLEREQAAYSALSKITIKCDPVAGLAEDEWPRRHR